MHFVLFSYKLQEASCFMQHCFRWNSVFCIGLHETVCKPLKNLGLLTYLPQTQKRVCTLYRAREKAVKFSEDTSWVETDKNKWRKRETIRALLCFCFNMAGN